MDKEELQQRSLQFAVDARALALRILSAPASRGTAEQLIRASSSVAANYRSACRGRSRAEFIAKLGIVVEECDESLFWLQYVERTQLLPAPTLAPLQGEARQLLAIFSASLGTARANFKGR